MTCIQPPCRPSLSPQDYRSGVSELPHVDDERCVASFGLLLGRRQVVPVFCRFFLLFFFAAWPPHCLRGPSLPLSAPGPLSGQTLAFLLSRQGARTGAVLGPSRHKKGTAACVEMHTSTFFQPVNRKVLPNPQQCGRILRTIFARRKGKLHSPGKEHARSRKMCIWVHTGVDRKIFRALPMTTKRVVWGPQGALFFPILCLRSCAA